MGKLPLAFQRAFGVLVGITSFGVTHTAYVPTQPPQKKERLGIHATGGVSPPPKNIIQEGSHGPIPNFE